MRRQKTDRQAIDVLKGYFSKVQIADKDGDLDRDGYVCLAWAPKTLSNGASGTINWKTDFGLPEIPKLVWLYIAVRDSGSAGQRYNLRLQAKVTTSNPQVIADAEPAVNDMWRDSNCCVAVAENGTTYYSVVASGVNTMDVYIRVYSWIK